MRWGLPTLVLLAACRSHDVTRTTSASTSSRASAAPAAADIPQTDFRGTFNGAKVYVTLEVHDGLASGSCFYEAGGPDVPLRGATDAHGALTISEMDDDQADLSHVALVRDAGGAWSGTWKSTDLTRSGPAKLEPISRRAGAPAVVATRRVHKQSLALCGWRGIPVAPCESDARVPVVLGLADRAFEKKLNDRLAAISSIRPPSNPVGLRVKIDFATPMNDRGFVSFEITARYLPEPACDKPGAACAGVYAYSHATGSAAGLTASVDAHAIATNVSDFVDVVKARQQLVDLVTSGFADCVTPVDAEQAFDRVGEGVLTSTGVAVLVDHCQNHVHGPTWRELSFATLGPALRGGSPFAPVWKR
jgi:hypothetical protein